MKASNITESVPSGVDDESSASESFAIPNKAFLVKNFRFTLPEDILFALEVDGDNINELMYRLIYERPYTKANEGTAILEVVATVILRCFNKKAIEELYLVNLLNFENPDVEMWKGVKCDWAAALHEALPKIWMNAKDYSKMNCSFIGTAIRQVFRVSTSYEIFNGIIWRKKSKLYRIVYSDSGIKRN